MISFDYTIPKKNSKKWKIIYKWAREYERKLFIPHIEQEPKDSYYKQLNVIYFHNPCKLSSAESIHYSGLGEEAIKRENYRYMSEFGHICLYDQMKYKFKKGKKT